MNQDTVDKNTGKRSHEGILVAGILLLLVSLAFWIYSYNKAPAVSNADKKVKDFLQQLDTAQPKLEIGYVQMSLESYNDNFQKSTAGENDMFTYPVYTNEVTTRLQTDSPHVTPDLQNIVIKNEYMQDFARLYRKRQLKPTASNVICLIIKQVGKVPAEAVVVNTDKVIMRDIEEIYDALDVGGSNEDSKGIRTPYNAVTQQQFALGKMKTGSSILIPVCITNFYLCLIKNHDPQGWQIASNVAYVPDNISYEDSHHKKVTLAVKDNLLQPLYMER